MDTTCERAYLKKAIEESGMRKDHIAKILGLSNSSFSHLLNGRKRLTFEQVKKISIIIDNKKILLEFFFNDTDFKFSYNDVDYSNPNDWEVIESYSTTFMAKHNNDHRMICKWNKDSEVYTIQLYDPLAPQKNVGYK